MFQNHCLHFSFLCSDIAYNKAIQETNITLIEENEEDLMKDYLPDDKIMHILFECLLDHHHVFAPPVKATKLPKAHVASLKKMNHDLVWILFTYLSLIMNEIVLLCNPFG